jgi:hypothetical protein
VLRVVQAPQRAYSPSGLMSSMRRP